MKQLPKEQLAELIIYSDSIHDILQEYDFKYEMKQEFSKIDKAVKNITKFAFGNESIGELDSWKQEIREFTNKLIEDKVYLKDV